MRTRTCSIGAAGTALATLLGCSEAAIGVNCTDEARPGLVVTVRDSVTTATLSGAQVVARTATTADTSRGDLPNGAYALAYETPGTYEVTVEKAGYRLWMRGNVRVTRDECHVKTVSLTALLQPQS